MAFGNLIPWAPNPGMATGGHSAPFLALRRDMERLFDGLQRAEPRRRERLVEYRRW